MTTDRVREILSYYQGENPGVLTNLARILNHGRLGGTGNVLILPVDQGTEHGPGRSFSANPAGFDPRYHFQLAIDARLSAYASTLGMLEAGAAEFAGQVPLILKTNGANIMSTNKNQAVTAWVEDALRLGCAAVGYTIYPGSEDQFEMIEKLRPLVAAARPVGLPTVCWSYPRGGMLTKDGETALDVTAYAAHLAASSGAHIIKVKPPSKHIFYAEEIGEGDKKKPRDADTAKAYAGGNWEESTLAQRAAHVIQAAFNGQRIVIFSGGPAKGEKEVLEEIEQLIAGGSFGTIMGRNSFQREHDEAVALLNQVMDRYEAAAKARAA